MVLLAAGTLWIATVSWMDGMSAHGSELCLGLTAEHIAGSAAIWVVMMAAMMLPASAPAISMFASFAGRDPECAKPVQRTIVFASGYLAVWTAVSIVFAMAQIVLGQSGVFLLGGTLAGPLGAGLLLLAAGLYELTPLKQACLVRCRNPLTYLMGHWRDGAAGAFRLGAGHGLHCVGCCIAMMGLMFVFGAMNLVWMAVLTVWFVIEKIVPRATFVSRHAGLILIGAGGLQTATVLAGLWPA
ncbi:MAG: DUF2182 domain-containing protein [Rhodobiaceae bacterium]|nr:DUF2182 domain-containing protein [Rhodobiaceae bacterium]MCC0048382.1 DUF2182 domain-containing protein [Rhodobiaceae bacterium]